MPSAIKCRFAHPQRQRYFGGRGWSTTSDSVGRVPPAVFLRKILDGALHSAYGAGRSNLRCAQDLNHLSLRASFNAEVPIVTFANFLEALISGLAAPAAIGGLAKINRELPSSD